MMVHVRRQKNERKKEKKNKIEICVQNEVCARVKNKNYVRERREITE
jgi:hypothetical protein